MHEEREEKIPTKELVGPGYKIITDSILKLIFGKDYLNYKRNGIFKQRREEKRKRTGDRRGEGERKERD